MTLDNADLIPIQETNTNEPPTANIWSQTTTYIILYPSMIGFFINLVALYVIGRRRQWQKTNYYLLNLVLCNIALLILNVNEKLNIFFDKRSYFGCKTFDYMDQVIVSVIMLTLLALIVHWYSITVRPNHPKRFLQRKRVIIVMIWLFCFICAIPFSHYNSFIIRKKSGPACEQKMPKYVNGIWTMIFFVAPMIANVILYLKIMRNIRESVNAAGYSTNRDLIYVHLKQIEWRRKAVTFILLAVVTLFASKFPEALYKTLLSWQLINATIHPQWGTFYLVSFFIYIIASAALFILTSMKANMLSRLEFNEKIDTQPPPEIQSLTTMEENSRL